MLPRISTYVNAIEIGFDYDAFTLYYDGKIHVNFFQNEHWIDADVASAVWDALEAAVDQRRSQQRIDAAYTRLVGDLREGASVRWTSQSRGKTTTKQGVIVAVVPAYTGGGKVDRLISDLMRKHKAGSAHGRGGARSEKSFIVLVDSRQPKLYWPRTKQLEVNHEEP